MPFRADVLRVFIASPGDLADDRDEVEKAIYEWNRQQSARQAIVLLPERWEGSAARQGGDGQGQINEQQVQNSDIVLAMLWTRLGQPTGRAASGTAEEIELGERFGKPTHVLVSRRPFDVGKLDPKEYERLKGYISKVQERGLTKEYHDSPGLRREVNNALWKAVDEHRQRQREGDEDDNLGVLIPRDRDLATTTRTYASDLGRLATIGYSTDHEELDAAIRSLTSFGTVLAKVTEGARALLTELVTYAGSTDFNELGLSARELCRRLRLSQEEVFDLVGELDRYGLATLVDDGGPAVVVLRDEPANLDWPFWGDLRRLENVTSGTIRRVVLELRFDALDASSAATATSADPGKQHVERPDIRWSLQRKGKNSFVLRNVGTATAEGVRVQPDSASAIARNLPESATLRPNESVEFLMIGAMGRPVPNEILVVSNGYEDEPQVVPVP